MAKRKVHLNLSEFNLSSLAHKSPPKCMTRESGDKTTNLKEVTCRHCRKFIHRNLVGDLVREAVAHWTRDVDPAKPVLSPNGCEIRGTLDVLSGTANIMNEKIVNGSIEFEYTGSTDVNWNSQETELENGQRLFVDTNYDIWREDQIIGANL